MSNHKVGRAPGDTSILAYVTRVAPVGHNGAHAFARCDERKDLGEISFSIETDPTKVRKVTWKGEWPNEGDYVRLDDVRKHRPSKQARLKSKRKRKDEVKHRAYKAWIDPV
ncbi:MAG: hypothetical protein WCV85_06250 [Patescibacteria group bacterium]